MNEETPVSKEEPVFKWKVEAWNEHTLTINLFRNDSRHRIGEFSFSIHNERILDPKTYDRTILETARRAPYPPDPKEIQELRSNSWDFWHSFADALETPPVGVAKVSMWTIHDEARGNLSVVRQLMKVALAEFKKRNVSYISGKYVSQAGDGFTEAQYAKDMYERMAKETGGQINADGSVLISVNGLEQWLNKTKRK